MRTKKKSSILIYTGLLLIAGAIFLTGYNLWSERKAAAISGAAMEALWLDISQAKAEREGEMPDYEVAPYMEMPTGACGDHRYIGILEIPALGLELPIIDEWSYPALKISPCRYAGSAYTDDMVIAAHNYRSHFGQIKGLQPGASVLFTDMDGNTFQYEMVSMEVLKDTAIEEMVSSDSALTLFTCTYSGQSRVTIRCERVFLSMPAAMR